MSNYEHTVLNIKGDKMRGTLFSKYFLEEGIKDTEDWKRLNKEELEDIYSKIEETFKLFIKRKRPDEADTEDGLICPLLESLGFQYSKQKSLYKKGRKDVPDFVLFPDENSKIDFDIKTQKNKPWDKVICILEGKRWQRALDKGDNTDQLDPHIPSNQILRYLSVAEPASNGKIVWGILTNGELWRLYYHRAPSRAEGFIEFDLSDIFGDPSLFDKRVNKLEKFKIFYLFFRKEAFIPTDWRPYKSFLEIALEEGKHWEERVSENIKDKIFYDVFTTIAKGFLEDAKTKKIIDDTFLKELYDNTLVLLYRLLFVFYAEDRDLLPISNNEYKNYSLSKIRDEVAEKIDKNEVLSESASYYWDRLKSLFKIINNGDKSLRIPPYNGGLFNDKKHPFLETYSVPDKFMVPSIDKLSRDYTTNPPKRINYRDLSVRQLGSMYEGLLEFKLKIADSNLGIKKEKGKEIYYTVDSEKEAEIKKGELYLTNDKSERKATGSYYTPDYIVQYIVKNTLEPLIQKKLQEFNDWQNKLKDTKKSEIQKLIQEFNISFDPKLYDSDGKIKEEKSINSYRNMLLSLKDPAESILKLKILDPAMGSGHFLVGAVDYIADRILEILAEISEKVYFGKEVYRSPLLIKLGDIRRRILEEAKEEGYIIDESKLEDKNLIKRIILKRCIYGVDINPLAVELAKVSLWLHTFTMGAPLSFLDHHLKCGNSLIGANPEDFEKEFSESPLFSSKYIGLMNAIQMIEKLQEITDADISEVNKSREIYDSVSKEMEPFKKLLDIYTAFFFLGKEDKYIISLINGTIGNPLDVISGKINLKNSEQALLSSALELAKNKRFFHWKLEFPEVWYERGGKKENGGFDVVIGNPPYIDSETMTKTIPDVREFLAESSSYTTAKGNWDMYVVFFEKGFSLLRTCGIMSFITPDKYLSKPFGYQFRKKFLTNVVKIAKAGRKVFEDSKVDAIITILENSNSDHINIENLETGRKDKYDKCTIKDPYNLDWLFSSHARLLSKIDSNATRFLSELGSYESACSTSDAYKLKQYIIDSFEFDAKKHLKVVNTGTIGRYFHKWGLKDMKYIGNIYKCPVVEKEEFFRTFRGAYAEKTQKPKLILKGLTLLEAFLDKDAMFIPGKSTLVFISKSDDISALFFTLAIVNSKIASFYIKERYPSSSYNEGINFTSEMLDNFPIPQIDFSNRNEKDFETLKSKYENGDFSNLEREIKTFPSNSAVLHDFLSFLAQKMTEISQNKYLIELFIEGKLQEGSEEKIKVIGLLEKHPNWEDSASETRKKEIAKNLHSKYEQKIKHTDELIDQIVYHLYGLEQEDIDIIEGFFNKSK